MEDRELLAVKKLSRMHTIESIEQPNSTTQNP